MKVAWSNVWFSLQWLQKRQKKKTATGQCAWARVNWREEDLSCMRIAEVQFGMRCVCWVQFVWPRCTHCTALHTFTAHRASSTTHFTAHHEPPEWTYKLIAVFQQHRYWWIAQSYTYFSDTHRAARYIDALSCQISSKSVNPLQWYCDFSIFQHGCRPPSWIYLGDGPTHGEYLVHGLYHCKNWLWSMQ